MVLNVAFAMPRLQAVSILSARPWASMRSRRCRPPPSIRPPALVNLTTMLAHCSGRMDRVRLAGLCRRRDRQSAAHGGGADLCAALCPLHPGRHRGRRRSRCARSAVSTPTPPTAAPERPKGAGNGTGNGTLNGGYHHSAERPAPRRYTRLSSKPPGPKLGAGASSELRDRLLAELNDIGGTDAAALWAKRTLPQKSSLTETDARHIEQTFQTKLLSFAIHNADGIADAAAAEPGPAKPVPKPATPAPKPVKQTAATIDKSVLRFPEPRRVRDREHVRYVAQQPCLICGRQPSDAHHLRFAQGRAIGRKVSDEFTVPLCRGHHREVHRRGDEAAWWKMAGIDPTVTARTLWLETRPRPPATCNINTDSLAPPPGTIPEGY